MSDLILSKAARCAAKIAFRVFPLKPGTKKPAISDWQARATSDVKRVKRLWATYPDANIGIATGGALRLFVLDVDGDDGKQSLAALEAQYGRLPTTVTTRTPRGSHYYFRTSEPLRNTAGKIGLGMDTRGEGGYVVGASSVLDGDKRYRYGTSKSPRDVKIASLPAWLAALARRTPPQQQSTADRTSEIVHAQSPYGLEALRLEADAVRSAPKGKRNYRLNLAAFSLGQLIAHGQIGRAQVEAALSAAARAAGLSTSEIESTLASGVDAGLTAPRRQRAVTEAQNADPLLANLTAFGETDTDNGRRLLERYGSFLRFVPEHKKWFAFDDTVWREDASKRQVTYAQKSARLIANEVDLLDGSLRADRQRWAAQSLGASAIKRTLEMAQPHAIRSIAQFDADPWLLNVTNGTLDLRTGKLRSFAAADYQTRIAGTKFDPDARCPRFKQFLTEIFDGDNDVIKFVQRFAGYSLTGDVTEQCFLFLRGAGQNGKSTLIQVLQEVLRDYACTASVETFLTRRAPAIRNDLARLHGARMVSTVEANPNQQLDEALVKQVTGGDRITARFLFGEHFEFVPQFKLWFVANHAPRLRSTDDALWRRVHVLPFDVPIPPEKRDNRLLNALEAELPGVLAWAVRGCQHWQKQRLSPPARVSAETRRYRQEVDHVRRFLLECVESSDSGVVSVAVIYERYERWSAERGEHAFTKKALGQRLVDAGYQSCKQQGARAWRGLRLLG